MRSLAELGIGLSVVFGIFVIALLAELCYIFYWKENSSPKAAFRAVACCVKARGARTDIIALTQKVKKKEKIAERSGAAGEFVRQASLVGSFGGLYVPAASELCTGRTDHNHLQAQEAGGSSNDNLRDLISRVPHPLFPIQEETTEDLEKQQQQLASSSSGAVPSSTSMLTSVSTIPRNNGDMLATCFTSGSASTSPAASVETAAFSTPPVSPRPPLEAKLSPYAARAVSQIFVGSNDDNCRPSPSILFRAEMHDFTAAGRAAVEGGGGGGRAFPPHRGIYHVQGRGTESGRIPLQLLFEQSPLSRQGTAPCTESPVPPSSLPALESDCPASSHSATLAESSLSGLDMASSVTTCSQSPAPAGSSKGTSYRHRPSLAALFGQSSSTTNNGRRHGCN